MCTRISVKYSFLFIYFIEILFYFIETLIRQFRKHIFMIFSQLFTRFSLPFRFGPKVSSFRQPQIIFQIYAYTHTHAQKHSQTNTHTHTLMPDSGCPADWQFVSLAPPPPPLATHKSFLLQPLRFCFGFCFTVLLPQPRIHINIHTHIHICTLWSATKTSNRLKQQQ